jgi:hypothetical protein
MWQAARSLLRCHVSQKMETSATSPPESSAFHILSETTGRSPGRSARLADGNGKLSGGMVAPTTSSIQLAKEYWVWSDALKPLLTELLGPPAQENHAAPIGGLSPDDSFLEMSAPLRKCHPSARLLPASSRLAPCDDRTT